MIIQNKRIVSGITPTGKVTIGNYLGAISNFIKLQEENEIFIFVANLHAITSKKDKLELRKNIKSMVALYYACGLKPEKANIFIQSDVLEHAQLGYILMCYTSIGELSRMTQYKDKKSKIANNYIPTGLLIYPGLMAADILLYDADFVPVGKDQKQHIELTRNLAERINNYCENQVFKIPENLNVKVGSKIMDLQNPLKKMSKSSENSKTYISLLDTPEIITAKIRSAKTDSENKVYYDIDKKPGISNLITIMAGFSHKSLKEVEKECQNMNYLEFKEAVTASIINILKPIQDKYNKLIKSSELDELIKNGACRAKEIARKKLQKVQNNIGINYKRL